MLNGQTENDQRKKIRQRRQTLQQVRILRPNHPPLQFISVPAMFQGGSQKTWIQKIRVIEEGNDGYIGKRVDIGRQQRNAKQARMHNLPSVEAARQSVENHAVERLHR